MTSNDVRDYYGFAMSHDNPLLDEWIEWKSKPYHAFNGHTMQRRPRYGRNAVIMSDSDAYCTEDCKACAEGYPLEDW